MSTEQQAQRLHQLIRAVTDYSDHHEIETALTTAFEIAEKAHDGIQRIDGQFYLDHPLAVAAILAEWHAPLRIVAAGLLHDLANPLYSREQALKETRLEKLRSEIGIDISNSARCDSRIEQLHQACRR